MENKNGKSKKKSISMIVYTSFDQRSQEWFNVKQGKMSASEMAALTGTPAAYKKYIMKKAFDITKKPKDASVEEFLPKPMQRGRDWEPFAYGVIEQSFGEGVKSINGEPVAFIELLGGCFGISPDYWNEEAKIGAEIKVMEDQLMAETIFTGKIPKKYFDQVMSYFLIGGVETVYFVAFTPGMENVSDKHRVYIVKVAKDMFVADLSPINTGMDVAEYVEALSEKILKASGDINKLREKL